MKTLFALMILVVFNLGFASPFSVRFDTGIEKHTYQRIEPSYVITNGFVVFTELGARLIEPRVIPAPFYYKDGKVVWTKQAPVEEPRYSNEEARRLVLEATRLVFGPSIGSCFSGDWSWCD